jgi:MYXO-CTERM domain-containing protein
MSAVLVGFKSYFGGRLAGAAAIGALLLSSEHASAVVRQPGSSVTLPVPPSLVERTLMKSFGWSATQSSYTDVDGNALQTPIIFGEYYSPPAFPQFEDDDAITLAGLFKWRGEAIDPQADATSPPGGLIPHCPVSVEPVLVGGNCQARVGWYNVSDPPGAEPPAEVFELVPELEGLMGCTSNGFCPLAWDNRNPFNLSIELWQRNPVVVDFAADPRYLGGAIGFTFMRGTSASQYCATSAYSVPGHNVRNASHEAFVGALLYPSVIDPGAVYVAFEDGVMQANDWTNGGKTDGDFNDYVFYAEGCFDGSLEGGAAGAGGAASTSAGAGGLGADGVGAGGVGDDDGGGQVGADAGAPPGPGTPAGGAAGNGTGETAGEAGTHGGTPAATDASDGCSCRVQAGPGAASLWLIGWLAAAAVARRRRRG